MKIKYEFKFLFSSLAVNTHKNNYELCLEKASSQHAVLLVLPVFIKNEKKRSTSATLYF